MDMIITRVMDMDIMTNIKDTRAMDMGMMITRGIRAMDMDIMTNI